MYARMIEAAREDDDLSGLRLAVSGSAPLGASLWNRFHGRFGVPLIERYGLTETGIVTSNPPGAPRGGSVGRPLRDTRVVIDTGGRRLEAAPGRRTPRGEICVSGPAVSAGYGNDPAATAAAYRDGLFHTGDLGYFDEDGYLWIDGRIKELIIVGGSNVVPGEVAAALEDVEGVAEIAVIGIPHEDLGETVAALVVPATAGAGDPQPARTAATGAARRLQGVLEARAEERLAAYKRPRRYAFVREIPRNAMGKIDVAACKHLLQRT